MGGGCANRPADLALTSDDSDGGDQIGHRGLGMYGDWLYFTTPDAHLVSLNAKDGTMRWEVGAGRL